MSRQRWSGTSQCAPVLERSENPVPEAHEPRVLWARPPETWASRHLCFGDEHLGHRRFILKNLTSESLDVKTNRRLHVCKRLLVGITLTNDDSLQTKGISDVAVGMLLDDDLHCVNSTQ